MAKVNFDISKKLDITCRKGDSFSNVQMRKDSPQLGGGFGGIGGGGG